MTWFLLIAGYRDHVHSHWSYRVPLVSTQTVVLAKWLAPCPGGPLTCSGNPPLRTLFPFLSQILSSLAITESGMSIQMERGVGCLWVSTSHCNDDLRLGIFQEGVDPHTFSPFSPTGSLWWNPSRRVTCNLDTKYLNFEMFYLFLQHHPVVLLLIEYITRRGTLWFCKNKIQIAEFGTGFYLAISHCWAFRILGKARPLVVIITDFP